MITLRIQVIALLILQIIIFPGAECYSQAGLITGKLRGELISRSSNDNEISQLLSSMNSDGSWSDINYSDKSRTNWDPVNHSRRLLSICIAFNKSSSVHYYKTPVRESIRKMLDYYISVNPISDNWWYNAIGAPTNFGPALVLLKTGNENGLTPDEIDYYADTLLNYYSESAKIWPSATTGANKIWLLHSSIHKAAATGNEAVMAQNFNSVFDEAEIMEGKAEGIKADKSFYQHGAQLYSAGYGMSFLNDMTYFTWLAADTEFRISSDRLKILTDAIIDGYMWFIHRSAYDYNTTGREISRPGAGSSLSLRNYINRLLQSGAPRSSELRSCIDFINGESGFPDPGNRHFWKSDIMVQHGEKFYLSAKVPSKRTIGTERMNNENLKRKWLPWGSTNIMTEGDEYRNLFPVWDWSRIPGVTSFLEEVPGLPVTGGSYIISSADFAGGCSDGSYGIAAYDYSWDGVSAKKAYFFTPEAMYCLGAGINSPRDKPVITSINQCYSSGMVITGSGSGQDVLTVAEKESTGVAWIHHDKTGYLFPAGGKIVIRNTGQTGSWYDINLSQSKSQLTHKVFSAWFSHGVQPGNGSYEYIVLPDKTPEQVREWSAGKKIYSITNKPEQQVFYDSSGDIYGIVLYNAGSVSLRSGLAVTADKPCLMLVRNDQAASAIEISVADPTQLLDKLAISVTKKLSGPSVIKAERNFTVTEIDLPRGDDAGKSVMLKYKIDSQGDESAAEIYPAYPNPSSGNFYLSEPHLINRLGVYDQKGKLVYTSEVPEREMPGYNWEPGIYFLRAEFENRERTSQILIKTK